MAELRTEEEQVEALKNWWKENGRSTVIGVVAAVAIVLGWRGWQDYQQNTAAAASALYQNLLAAAVVQQGESLTEEKRKTAEHLAGQLKTDFESLAYARYAALWLAKSAVESGNLTRAEEELNWVLSHDPDETLAGITRLRLARVQLAMGNADQALSQLKGSPAAGFQASFYEVQGDIYQAMGREEDARQAYVKAKAAPQGEQRPLLAMKLDDLAVAEGN